MTIDEFIIKLDNAGKNIDLTNALEKCALVVENKAKRNCPVDNGELRNSIHHETKKTEATIGTSLEYAPYVEYGTGLFAENGDGRDTPWRYQSADGEWHTTSGQEPQPYLRPALQSSKDEIESIISEAVLNAISGKIDKSEITEYTDNLL